MPYFQPPAVADLIAALPEISSPVVFASGGFKVVYTAQVNGRHEAVKLIGLPTGNDKASYLGRLKREVTALEKCATANELVKLGSIKLKEVQIGASDFLVYSEELLNGSDLQKLIDVGGTRPDETEIRTLLRCLMAAIKALSKNGYVHRDIKPGNIVKLSDGSRPFVLLDLGLAFAVSETPLTAPGVVPGTPHYLAPEMLTAPGNFRDALDHRSDMYTAALTAYVYATGVHPLYTPGENHSRILYRAVRERCKPLSNLREDFSKELCKLIDQMLKKKPALRPQIEVVCAELERTTQ